MGTSFYKKIGAGGLEKLAQEWKVNDDIKITKRLSRKGEKILDLACGYGRVSIPLAQAGRDITGLDLAENLIHEAKRRARRKGLKVRLDVGNMTSLPYKRNTFDKIFCLWNSFNELLKRRDQRMALNETFRVLKEGGMAFIVMIDGENKRTRQELRKFGIGVDKRILYDTYHGIKDAGYIHDRESFKKLCQESHFSRFRIKFRNMNARRRIVAYLYK